MKRPLSRAVVLCAITAVAAVAHAATFPADVDWIPLTQQGAGMADVVGDGSGNGREIVGTPVHPALLVYVDGTNLFVRLRLDSDPEQSPGNLRAFGWGLLVDTDGILDDYEFSLMVNGIPNPDRIELAENTTKTGLGDPSDQAESLINSYPWDSGVDGNGRVLLAPTTFGDPAPDADYFLDFAVPLADLAAAGISPDAPLIFWGGTSSNARSISLDLAGTATGPGPSTLALGASDPITLNDLPSDVDRDGILDVAEIGAGTDPNDADSDDDGVLDGGEPNWRADTDGDGLINALDPDSDDDALADGTELGLDCGEPATDAAAGRCQADGDAGATTTDPLLRDTDGGGTSDGSEDWDRDGAIDAGETDPTAGEDADDDTVLDADGDGLGDALELSLGSDPDDQDDDDDGLLDGLEPNPADDHDGDGLVNLIDEDSDGDGLYDGTERGLDCGAPATDPLAEHCIADGDAGATRTGLLDADSDDGGTVDGIEDANHNGVVDAGERDPNDPVDDLPCTNDGDCGSSQSGVVCSDEICIPGCRGTSGNGCPPTELCTSTDSSIGECIPGGGGGAGGGTGGGGAGGGATGGGGEGTGGGDGGGGGASPCVWGGECSLVGDTCSPDEFCSCDGWQYAVYACTCDGTAWFCETTDACREPCDEGAGGSASPSTPPNRVGAAGSGLCAATPGRSSPNGAWLLLAAALAWLARNRRLQGARRQERGRRG